MTILHQKKNEYILTRRELFEPLVTTEIPIPTFDENKVQIIQANIQCKENMYRSYHNGLYPQVSLLMISNVLIFSV